MKKLLTALLLVVVLFSVFAFAEEAVESEDIETVAVTEEATEETVIDGESDENSNPFINTAWALLPPAIAIILALITKEAYSSLFIGILAGGLLYANFNPETAILHVFNDGIVSVLSDSYNVGILVFLIVLGAMVQLMNATGGSAAFGDWAAKHIKTRVGAQLATVALGVLIFIDDYFNCLTVGNVMRPVTDKHGISRAKLAYLVDATAAPICIIAPISSWAAAVSSYVEEGNGLQLFIKAIPFNFYAILTIAMMILMSFFRLDYGSMVKAEKMIKEQKSENTVENGKKGRVIDLVVPVIILIISCTLGMIYSGGFFSGESFINAFSNSDASVGLMLGSFLAIVLTMIFYGCRRALTLRQMMDCLPKGFSAMVPAVLILTFAWSLKAMTDSLGATVFVDTFVKGQAGSFDKFLPAIVFVIACVISFATGTSWGTFGILIPITLSIFPLDNPLGIVCMSACMAGAVTGDHCSPISDTTIMASAGAQCEHVQHVSTQLPYALTVAAISFVCYIIAGFVPNWLIVLPIGIVMLVVTLIVLKNTVGKKANA